MFGSDPFKRKRKKSIFDEPFNFEKTILDRATAKINSMIEGLKHVSALRAESPDTIVLGDLTTSLIEELGPLQYINGKVIRLRDGSIWRIVIESNKLKLRLVSRF